MAIPQGVTSQKRSRARIGKAGAPIKTGASTRRGQSFVADIVRRAVDESQHERPSSVWKGKARAFDDDDASYVARAAEPANMQPQQVVTADAVHHASARVGVAPSSAAPAASSAAATQAVVASSAVQSTPATASSAAFPVAESASSSPSAATQSPASSSAASQTQVVSSTVAAALSSSSATAAPSSSSLSSIDASSSLSSMASSTDASSSSALSSLSSASTASPTAAQASQTPNKVSLAHNTPLMVLVILGSIIGGATVLFGLAWLCKRSNLGPNRRARRQRALNGNWSPGAGSSSFSLISSDVPDMSYAKEPPMAFPERPAPAMPGYPTEDPNHFFYGQLSSHNAAPLHRPQSQGWELFDRPLEMQPAPAPLSRPAAPRRPTFIQRAIDQPQRGATLDLEARLSHDEQAREVIDEGASRSNTTGSSKSSTATTILQALGLSNSMSTGRDKHSSWTSRIRRKSTSVPDDSDFEGTIGAPDKEVPRANRVKKGRRFACDVTSGEEDSSPEDGPLTFSNWQRPQPGLGMYLAPQSNASTPKTPGMAGMGAGGRSRHPPMPLAMNSTTVPGRQLLLAPGLASQKALKADDLTQRTSSLPREDRQAELRDRVSTWWTGSWDAEWPSPTESQHALAAVPDGLVSPRSIDIPAPSSTFAHSDREDEGEVEIQQASPSSIDSEDEAQSQAPSAMIPPNEYMLHAQNSLRRMGSIRPTFAPATTLDSWLDAANGPRNWMTEGNVIVEEDVADEEDADTVCAADDHEVDADKVGAYQGSLKSPMVLTNDLPSDFFVGSDDEDYRPLRHQSSSSTLRSSRSNRSLRASIPFAGGEDGAAIRRLQHRSSARSLASSASMSSLDAIKQRHSVRKQRSLRHLQALQQLEEKRLSLALQDSPDHYIDSDGYEVRKVNVGLATAPQPSRASLVVRKESIRGQSSDVSDYECEAAEEVKQPARTALSEYEAIFAASANTFRAPDVAAAVAAAGDVRKLRQKSSHKALKTARSMSCIEEVDRALMALAVKRQELQQSQSRLGNGKRRHQRRAISTGRAVSSGLHGMTAMRPQHQQHQQQHHAAPPPTKPRYGHIAGDASPSSSSDSDISVRRWGRPGDDALPYISGSDSEGDPDEIDDLSVGNITIGGHTSSSAATLGAIADWNAAKKRRAGHLPRGRASSSGGRMRVVSAGGVGFGAR